MRSRPEISADDRLMVADMQRHAMRGWYTGDLPSLQAFGVRNVVIGRTAPELHVSLLLSRDKMHHSVGWWRNADYEYCWHLSIAAFERDRQDKPEDIPPDEERYWTFAFFPTHFDKLWHEPGGTDPRLTPEEKMRHKHFAHLRLFLDPVNFQPFIPEGEVYTLTRWIPGLTPEKVDR